MANPVGAFPIVDAETLAARIREYHLACYRILEYQRQVARLQRHIVRRARALQAQGVDGALAMLPEGWTTMGDLGGSAAEIDPTNPAWPTPAQEPQADAPEAAEGNADRAGGDDEPK